jgi:hypothetical protein
VPSVEIKIEVELTKVNGPFASNSDIIEELEGMIASSLDSVYVGDSEYEITDYSITSS